MAGCYAAHIIESCWMLAAADGGLLAPADNPKAGSPPVRISGGVRWMTYLRSMTKDSCPLKIHETLQHMTSYMCR
eukprot:scaffold15609_cov55-Attheya_sp.AAC.1